MKLLLLYFVVWVSVSLAGYNLTFNVPWPEPREPALGMGLLALITWVSWTVAFWPIVLIGMEMKRRRISKQFDGAWDV